MEESYQFDDHTWEALAKAGVSPLSVTDVVHGRHRLRRHIGAVFQIAGQDRNGNWVGVIMIELDDDQYLVRSARYLEPDEVASIEQAEGRQS